MEDQFPSSGKSQAMNTQLGKTLSVLLLILMTATPSHAFHLPVHHSNSTNVNKTDSADFHHGFHGDSHHGNSTEGYQYGRLSSHISESTSDVQKEDYKNYTVRIVPPLVNHPKTHDKGGNTKVKTGQQMTSGQIKTGILDTHQEEAKELSQHGVTMEINKFTQNQKTETKQDNGPAIAVYKSEIQKTEPDTLTKLLSLEQRIANYLLQHKHQYLHKSPKETKIDEKKEVVVDVATTNMANPAERDGNAKEILPDKNVDAVYLRPRTYGKELQEEITEVVNIKVVPKYNLYDGIGKDDIKTDNVVKDYISKDDIIKEEIRKENVKNKDKTGASNMNGKDGSIKEDNKLYDDYYDSEGRQVVGSTRTHYDYDDKGYVTEDTINNKEDKHKSKETLKEKQGEKLVRETEIFHETGSFHTVENFVEEKFHSQKQQQTRWKPKPGFKNIDDNDKEISVSAFKAVITRGDDENDKKIDDQKHSLTVDQQFGVNNSGPSSKDKDSNGTNDSVGKKGENILESNKQLSIGGQFDTISPGNNNDDINSLSKKDELIDKQLNRNISTSLGLTSVRNEEILSENDNEADKNDMGIPDREDEAKIWAKSEITNESKLLIDHKALSGVESLEEVNILFKYSTDDDLPIIRDANQTSSESITQGNMLVQSGDGNDLDTGDLKKVDARSEAYIAGWASTASKNSTDPNIGSNSGIKSFTRLETGKENKEAPVGDNKTMITMNQGINKTNTDNKTAGSQVMGNIPDNNLKKQNEQEIKRLKINSTLSNQEMQNTSPINESNIKQSNNSSNDTNINDHTVRTGQDQTTSNVTSSNNNIHNDNKMVVDVNKLNATPEAADLKLIVSENVERASSSRKVVSQINDYEKVPVHADPFYGSAATKSNSNNRKLSAKEMQLETNATGGTIKAPDNSYNYKNNQSVTQIQDMKQEISNQASLSVDAKERNNSSMHTQELSMESNSSIEYGKVVESKKEVTPFRDDLNSTTNGTSYNLSESGFIRNNASSQQFTLDQAKRHSNSSTDILKVHVDDKLQSNQSAGINITATQTSKFKVESFLATSNQSEARNKQPETEKRISEADKPSPTIVLPTKIHAPTIKSTTVSNNTLKSGKSGGKEDPWQLQKKADVKTTVADKTKVIDSLSPLSPKISVTANQNQGNHVNNVKEMKNDTSFINSSRADFISLDGNNRNHTEKQHNGSNQVVNYLSNGSNLNGKTEVSNKSVGLNVPRKLLSFAELEIHENKSNKTIATAHKVENNHSLTGESFNTSKLSVSKLNVTNSKVNTTTVKTATSSSSTGGIWKNVSEISNDSHINPAVKVKNSDVNNVHLHGNATTVSLKLEPVPELSRTEQNISINGKIENTIKAQNSSNVHKNKEKDPVVTITFTVKKNSSNPRIEKLAENGTSNSFNKKTGLQPEVMANERHHQQKSQNQKLEPEILLKGELSDRTDLKIDVNSNKDDSSSRIIGREDDEKSQSVSSSSQNSGTNIKISDGGDDEEDIGSQQTAGDQRNDNAKDNTKNENNDKLRNKNDGGSDSNNSEGGTITNKDVLKRQLDETTAMEQEMGKGISQKNSDLRSDNTLSNVDTKQIQNVDNVSSNQKTTNVGKDNSQDVDSATSIDKRLPEADVESGSLQNEADTKSDDANDETPKTDKAGNSSGLSSAGSSGKIPEISPYKIQDFSLLKPGATKAASSKDKNKTEQLKAKPPQGVAAPNNVKGNSSEASTNGSNSVRGEFLDGGILDVGVGAPQRAQAAVSAVLTTHFGPTKDQMIPFDLELLDLADNYDNTTGMFICTIPGTYVISLYLMSHPGAKVNARVLINNRPIAALWADDAKNAGFYPSSSTQTIAQLAFGDQVYVMLVDGGYGDSWVHANYNVFTIFLLYEQMF